MLTLVVKQSWILSVKVTFKHFAEIQGKKNKDGVI